MQLDVRSNQTEEADLHRQCEIRDTGSVADEIIDVDEDRRRNFVHCVFRQGGRAVGIELPQGANALRGRLSERFYAFGRIQHGKLSARAGRSRTAGHQRRVARVHLRAPRRYQQTSGART